MDKKDFIDHKKSRLEEISKVIKESSERIDPHPPKLEDLSDRLEKLKSDHPWLR